MEGDGLANYNPCDGTPLTPPILVYDHNPECSVTGGFVYRGNIGGLHGRYVFGDYCSGVIWFGVSGSEALDSRASGRTRALRISSFGEDEAGELYVVDLVEGEIFRFESPSAIFTDLFESGDAVTVDCGGGRLRVAKRRGASASERVLFSGLAAFLRRRLRAVRSSRAGGDFARVGGRRFFSARSP